jgi:hypothetical protein
VLGKQSDRCTWRDGERVRKEKFEVWLVCCMQDVNQEDVCERGRGREREREGEQPIRGMEGVDTKLTDRDSDSTKASFFFWSSFSI